MAKNITILEGRETRTFGNTEKLRTNLVGGGTQDWIPEDEAMDYVDAEELDVTENGYYEPSAGTFYNGVNVEVEVEPDLEELEVTENGTYTPSGDGFSSVTVNVDAGGSGEEAETHGTPMSAIAQTDINAGDTVAVQSPSKEPIAVVCPLTGIGSGGNPFAYDGKFIYWYVGDANNSELRKKPLSKIESEEYTVYMPNVEGAYGFPANVGGGYVATGKIQDQYVYVTLGSIFTNKQIQAEHPSGGTPSNYGKFTVFEGKVYDNKLKAVNTGGIPLAWGEYGFIISSARYLKMQVSYGYNNSFIVGLMGGDADTYVFTIPSGYAHGTTTNMTLSHPMPCGTNKVCFILRDGVDVTKHCIIVCDYEEEEEYEGTTHNIESTMVYEWHCSTYHIGHDTLFDRWGIGTDNGLIILQSDISYEHYERLQSSYEPFLAGEYVWFHGQCYKLIGDDAIMIATTSKGTDGLLGVAQSSVRAGETGTAIILFS